MNKDRKKAVANNVKEKPNVYVRKKEEEGRRKVIVKERKKGIREESIKEEGMKQSKSIDWIQEGIVV